MSAGTGFRPDLNQGESDPAHRGVLTLFWPHGSRTLWGTCRMNSRYGLALPGEQR